ncbi:Two-component response regulator [Quillaja saponaria]|uniref:Two-component response regulator n=1 Tax=Quillaja saponaria TaxID=32244 RepID=A0AAD7L558_QUISA|nr:Two-component response regulator [Quillaja saponaria]
MESEKMNSIDLSMFSTPILGIRVLVVDCDSTSLAIISKMLGVLGYEVLTATGASDALSIAQEKRNELHFVLMEMHLPDMERYEFIEKMEQKSKLPFIIMTADSRGQSMLGALQKGAALYIRKPVTLYDLRTIWKLALVKRKEREMATGMLNSCQGESSQPNASDEDIESQPFMRKGQQTLQRAKRKEPEQIDKYEEEDAIDTTVLKKQKLDWVDDLNMKFLEGAHPEKILQNMIVPGLGKEKSSSHLQKYCLSSKWQHEAIQKALSTDSSGPSPTPNLEGSFLQCSEQQFVTCQPDFIDNFQMNICSCMSMYNVPGSARFPSHEVSSGHESSISTCNQQGFAYTTSSLAEININGEMAFQGEVEGDVGEIFKGEMALSNVCSVEDATHCPRLLSNDMQQQFSLLPTTPPPWKEERDTFEVDLGEIDDFTKGSTHQLWDEIFGYLIPGFDSSSKEVVKSPL